MDDDQTTRGELLLKISLLEAELKKLRGEAGNPLTGNQTDTRLREAETKYRIIADNTHDWEYWLAPDGSFIYTSPSCERITGWEPEKFIGDPAFLLEIIQPDDRASFLDHAETMKTRKECDGFDFRIVRRDGEIRHIGHRCLQVFDGEGRFLGIRGSNRDITEKYKLARRIESLNTSARTVLVSGSFKEAARKIFDKCKLMTGATSGYVALLSDDGRENEVLFLDAGGLKCTVNPELPMPIRGLRADAYRTGEVVFHNDFMNSEWENLMPAGHVTLKNVLFAPMNIDGKTNGIIGLANKPGDFTEEDAGMVMTLGELAAVALRNSRNIEALKAGEMRLRMMFENSSNCIAVYKAADDGEDFIILDFNRAAEQAERVDRAEIVGRGVREVFPGVVDFGLFDVFRRVWNTGEPEHHDIRMYKDNRISGWRENYVYKLPSGEVVSIYSDVTEKKKAEQAIRESEERFRITLMSIGDAVITTDPQGRVKTLNARAETMTGWSMEEAAGRPLEEVFNIINEDTRLPAENPVRRVVREGIVMGLANHTSLISRGGAEIPISDSGAPIFDTGGDIIGVVMVFQDQTEERAAQKRLKDSEERFRAVADHFPAALYIKDINGKYIFINKEAEKIFGETNSEAAGKTADDFFPGAPSTLYSRQDMEVLDSRSVKTFTDTQVRDGKEYIYDTVKFPLVDAEGELYALVCISTDVTESRRAEAALRESEEKYRTLFNQSSEGIYLHDFEGRILDVNEVACLQSGYSREELLGMTVFDLHPAGGSDRNKSKEQILQEWRQWPQEHRFTMVIDHIHKDGTMFPAHLSTGVIRHKDRNLILAIVMDITEQKLAEEALRVSEKKFRSLFDSMSEGAALHEVVYGASGEAVDYKIVDVNPAYERIVGLKKESAVGELASGLYGMGTPPFLDVYAKVADAGAPAGFEVFFSPLGKYFSVSAVSPGKGAFATIFTDITERKASEIALRESESRLRALSQNIISMQEDERARLSRELHDYIGRVLTGLALETAWIMEQEKPQKDQLKTLAKMIDGSAAEVRRICKGLRPMILDDMGLKPAIRSLVKEYEGTAAFSCKMSLSDVARNNIDPEVAICVFRVAQESLTNAARHSRAGKVSVTLRKSGKSLELVIKDDGEGFSKAEKSQGLGLMGMRERAMLCGGSIEIESEPGKGTVVRMTAPLK